MFYGKKFKNIGYANSWSWPFWNPNPDPKTDEEEIDDGNLLGYDFPSDL